MAESVLPWLSGSVLTFHSIIETEMGPHHRQIDRVALLTAKCEQAFALLLDAAYYAQQTSGDSWEYAVEIHHLRRYGLSDNDLRYFIRRKWFDHAGEVSVLGQNGRQFQPTGELLFTKRSCFILTPLGVSAVLRQFGTSSTSPPASPTMIQLANGLQDDDLLQVPTWDVERRTLSFQGRVVKRFKVHAVNQVIVLSAFEEDGWPVRIDDPLVPLETLDIKRRLHDTIKSLNRCQTSQRIHFHGDGTGEGVAWEPVVSKCTRQIDR
jgi:hypothetical protein